METSNIIVTNGIEVAVVDVGVLSIIMTESTDFAVQLIVKKPAFIVP